MTIGERLKYLRDKMNYTQEYVADRMQCRSQTIYKYEKDLTKIPSDKVEKLAEIYETTPGFILGWETAEKAYTDNAFTEKRKALMDACAGVSDDDIDIAIRMIKALKGEK